MDMGDKQVSPPLRAEKQTSKLVRRDKLTMLWKGVILQEDITILLFLLFWRC